VTCANCGAQNDPGQKFCGECGSRLSVACDACGAPNPPGRKFCGECGAGLVAAPGPVGAAGVAGGSSVADVAGPETPERPASQRRASEALPVAERRLVTVLFADLVGFTTLAEQRDAEETRELLSRYFDLSRDVIERYGGTVEKFIGDAVMAVWGAPVAREDDAERAVRSGLELIDAVGRLGSGITARAGILTGEAAVTIGAVGQGMVAGDIVNTASRLQAVALPGSVLVGEATHRAASVAIAFEPAGEQLLKGKSAPVPAWRALRVVAERGGRGRSEALEAPFVGRDDELRLLKDLFHATSREGRARLVSVIGPAGIGKTRLAWEFTKYLDGLVEAVWWHDGRSPAYGDGISFWALGEMVRGRCGLVEDDDEATTRRKVAAALEEHVLDVAERRWIEPALLALLGFETNVASEQLFGAWRTFFERLAATGPVVMVFEDFHFADPGLIDFVDHLLEWSRAVPIYVVTLARPELLDKRQDWGAGKRNFTSLYLEPLSEEAMRQLLAGLVPGLPEGAIRAIVARADGIPLYAVETVRMLLSQDRLALDGDVYRPVGDLTTLAVPETLTALIASRLDGLDPADRQLVSDAAVLGQSFTIAGLAAVAGNGQAELEPRLRALVRRELLTLADPRSPEKGQYAFVQALIREVAYNTLSRRDRKTRHLAAARFFESLGTDEVAGALAGHYLAAHSSAAEGPEAEALAAQARIALRAAADRAVALESPAQASVFLRQALTVTTEPAEEAEVLERVGDIASVTGRHAEAEESLTRAADLYRRLGDRSGAARATAGLARALVTGHRSGDAVALLEPAVAEFADLAGDPALVALQSQLARAYSFTGDRERAVEMADRALEVAEHADLIPLLADTLVTKGTALSTLGRVREGIGVIDTGARLARSAGLVSTYLRGVNNLNVMAIDIDPAEAVRAVTEGLELARRMGLGFWVIGFANSAALGAFRLGDWERAMALSTDALREEAAPADRFSTLTNIGIVQACRGNDVGPILQELEQLLGTSEDLELRAGWLNARGIAALAAGRLEDAQVDLDAAGELTRNDTDALALAAHAAVWRGDLGGAAAELAAIDATGIRTPVVEARRAGIRAAIAAGEGPRADAIRLFRDALRRWRDLYLVFDEALCAIDMATLLDPADPGVQAATESARGTLVGLGAAPLVARLDVALDRPSTPREQVPATPDPSSAPATA
jgi:class 3 adenylate cyclase/tetratricopeptide (TPR) repeat protein